MRKIIAIIMTVALVVSVSACSGQTILSIAKKKYDLKDTVESSVHEDDVAYIFMSNKSVKKTADELMKAMQPERVSNYKDGKQALIYEDYFVILTPDEKQPKKTNIEVSTYGFVRDNYRPSFFHGMFLAFILADVFDADDWYKRQAKRCKATGRCYKGYNKSGGSYKGPSSKPLFKSSPFRGGGLGAGK